MYSGIRVRFLQNSHLFYKIVNLNVISNNFSSVVNSTIYALSSGFGKCGVAVIRVSGANTIDVAKRIAGLKNPPEPRKVLLRRFKDPETRDVLDHGLFLYFAGPHSFTGEDSCELQIHGGSAVIASVLQALSKVPGCRPAEPGEFTKRAFYAGKFDLTEVEGLADLINAETEAQRRQALLQMDGALNRRYTEWRRMLLKSLAHVEAYIDFSEEENIEENLLETVNKDLQSLKTSILKHVNDGRRGEKTRNGVKTVIVGPPNVGKSSLLNALCHQPAAIVSPIPGTTRDIVRMSLDIGGYPVSLYDTAGLRKETQDIIENEGMSRAYSSAANSDLIIAVVDSQHYLSWKSRKYKAGKPEEEFLLFIKEYFDTLKLKDAVKLCQNAKPIFGNSINSETDEDCRQCLIVFNKIDLVNDIKELENISDRFKDIVVSVSCKTDNGFDKLTNLLTQSLKSICGNSTRENPTLTQERHRFHLLASVSALDRYFEMSTGESASQIDIAAEQIRKAASELGKVTGNISAEDVLDVIFKEFCIGK